MLKLPITTLLLSAVPHLAIAATDQSWPWTLFGPQVEHCAQLDKATRQRLSASLPKAAESTRNLLPARIWRSYEEQIARHNGSRQAPREVRVACDALVEKLGAPDLSARLRGEVFLGLLQHAPYDCVLGDADKGGRFLAEFRKFYQRNGLVFPDEVFRTQLAIMRAEKWKILNGWDTPHCMDMQRSLGNGDLDASVSEDAMRKRWLAN